MQGGGRTDCPPPPRLRPTPGAIGWCAWLFTCAGGVLLLATNTYLLHLLRAATAGGALHPPRDGRAFWLRLRAVTLPVIKLLL